MDPEYEKNQSIQINQQDSPEQEDNSSGISSPMYGMSEEVVDQVNPLSNSDQEGASLSSIAPPPYSIQQDNTNVVIGPMPAPEHDNDAKKDESDVDIEEKKKSEVEDDQKDEPPVDNNASSDDENDDSEEDAETNDQTMDDADESNPNDSNPSNAIESNDPNKNNISGVGGSSSINAIDNSAVSSRTYKPQNGGSSSNLGGPIEIPVIGETPTNNVSLPSWKGSVKSASSNVETPELKTGKKAEDEIKKDADSKIKDRNSKKEGYQGDLKKELPDSPEAEEEPKGNEVQLKDQAMAIMNPHKDKKLPDQKMPPLEKTPSGDLPVLGDTVSTVKGEEAVKNLEAEVAMTNFFRNIGIEIPKTKTEERLEQMKGVLEARSKTVSEADRFSTIKDLGPPKRPPLSADLQADIGGVIATILADPAGRAEKIVTSIRKKAYPEEILQKTYPEIGANEIPGLATTLKSELSNVAEEAGVSAQELEEKIAKRKEEVAKQKADAEQQATMATEEGKMCLMDTSKKEVETIENVKKAADENALEKMEAAKGSNDPEVIKLKANAARVEVSKIAGKQQVFYDQSKKRRHTQLDRSKLVYQQAYKAAAEREKIKVKSSHNSETEKEGDTNKLEYKIAQVDVWLENNLRKLENSVTQLKAAATKMVKTLKTAITEAAATAKKKIDTWEEQESNKQKSWWQKLWDSITNWFAESKAKTEAWEQINAQESIDSLKSNLSHLDEYRKKHGEQITAEQIEADKKLTAEQKVILKSYYSDGPDRGNSIAAVAEGYLLKISNKHQPQIIKKFIAEVEKKPASEWRQLDAIARASNGSFSGLTRAQQAYNAMKGHGFFGAGTQEDKVYKALEGLNNFEMMVVKKCYRDKFDADLKSHIKGEFSDAEEDRALALLESNSLKADAAKLNHAMKGGTGIGTDEKAIMETLRGKSEAERVKLYGYYKEEYGVDLKTHLKGELSSHDKDRADALLEGNTSKADAIALDQAMNGGWTGIGTDTAAMEGVYADIRKDTETDFKKKRKSLIDQAKKENWSESKLNEQLKAQGLLSSDIEKAVTNSNLKVEVEYNSKYGNDEQLAQGESAFRTELVDEMEDAELDLFNAIADNDQKAIDSARLKNEFESWIDDDDTINGVLEKQYDRNLQQIKLDKMPGIELRLEKEAAKKKWTTEKLNIEKRKAEAKLEKEAEVLAKKSMTDLENRYNSDYGGDGANFKADIISGTQGNGEDKAEYLMDQGFLTDAQQIYFAVDGLGTDKAKLQAALKGKTKEEIAEIEADLKKLYPGETLKSIIEGDTSGGDEFDTLMLAEGLSETREESLDKAKRRSDRADDDFVTEEYNWLKKQHDVLNDPNASEADKWLAEKYFDNGVTNVETAASGLRERESALANSVAQVAAVTAAIIVAAAITFFSGGTGSGAGAGLVASVWGAMATETGIAVTSALVATATSMGVKQAMLGDDYGDEDVFADLGMGAIDVATAGVFSKLKLGELTKVWMRAGDNVTDSRTLAFFKLTGAEFTENFLSGIPSAVIGNATNSKNWTGDDAFLKIMEGAFFDNLKGAAIGTGTGKIGNGANSLAEKYSPYKSKGVGAAGESTVNDPDIGNSNANDVAPSNSESNPVKSDQIVVNDPEVKVKVDADEVSINSPEGDHKVQADEVVIVQTPDTDNNILKGDDGDTNPIIDDKVNVVPEEITKGDLKDLNDPIESDISPLNQDEVNHDVDKIIVKDADEVIVDSDIPEKTNTPESETKSDVKTDEATTDPVNLDEPKVPKPKKNKTEVEAGDSASDKYVDPWEGIEINNAAEQKAKDLGLPPEPEGYDYKLSTKGKLFIQRTAVKVTGDKPKLEIKGNELVVSPSEYKTSIDSQVRVVDTAALHPSAAGTFTDSVYRTVVTNTDVTVYRAFGPPKGFMEGAYVTTKKGATRSETAILSEWGNSLRFEAKINIPPETTLNIGTIKPQTSGSEVLAGGADQVLMPRGWKSSEMVTEIVDTQTGEVYSYSEFIAKFPELIKKQ